MKRLFTIPESGEYAGCSESWLKKNIREGKLPVKKLGRHTRIDIHDLDAFIDSLPGRTVGTSAGTELGPDWSPTESGIAQPVEGIVKIR